MDPIVELQAAGVSLGGHPVLRDLDLTLLPGQTVGVAGPNGSGKTTLVRTVATLVPIDEGELFLFGRRVDGRDLAAIRSSIGLIGHQPALIPELTLFENLVHVCRLTGVDEGRVGRALDVVGLAGRIGASCVLAGSDYPHPEGLASPAEFADELAGLDVEAVRAIMRENFEALVAA